MRINNRLFKPVPLLVKINFDGIVVHDLGKAGVGVVVRNTLGMVLASMSKQIPLPYSMAEVEVIATMKAVNFALEGDFSSIVFEGDFKVVIKAFCSEDESFSYYGHLIF